MKTTSINIFSLNVPCCNKCRYCLLSWDGTIIGTSYNRSLSFARKFYEWLKNNHSNLSFSYYFGYSMDHPNLFDVIKFLQETNSPGGKFLQFDGMKKRTNEELNEFLEKLKESGIETLNFTIYGKKEFHDRFAGRIGDFNLMINTINIAKEKNIKVEVGIPVIKENINQLTELVDLISNKNIRVSLFTPHCGGKGIFLYDSKITIDDYESLDDHIKKLFNRNNNKTQSEWLLNPPKEVENRVLTLSLTKENIDELESKDFEDIIKSLEEQDEKYYSIIPSFNELLTKYCDKNDNKLYTKKDLYMIYRKKYIDEKNIIIKDINDERYSGSIRY